MAYHSPEVSVETRVGELMRSASEIVRAGVMDSPWWARTIASLAAVVTSLDPEMVRAVFNPFTPGTVDDPTLEPIAPRSGAIGGDVAQVLIDLGLFLRALKEGDPWPGAARRLAQTLFWGARGRGIALLPGLQQIEDAVCPPAPPPIPALFVEALEAALVADKAHVHKAGEDGILLYPPVARVTMGGVGMALLARLALQDAFPIWFDVQIKEDARWVFIHEARERVIQMITEAGAEDPGVIVQPFWMNARLEPLQGPLVWSLLRACVSRVGSDADDEGGGDSA